MREIASCLLKRSLLIMVLSVLGSGPLLAQSNQYKRKKLAKPATKAKASSKKKNATNQKLDLENLEKRYWAPKDTEFKVVQNRKFKKAKRYNVTVMGGILFNDPFIDGTNLSVSTAHYFDEHHGIELRYEHYSHSMGEAGKQVIAKGGQPDVNYEKYFIGANYSWIPFYGKFSVMDEKIVYFDMAFSAGLGLMNYEQQSQIASAVKSKSAVAVNLDVSQQFFIQKNTAFRFDVRTKIYNEDTIRNTDGYNLGSKTQINTYIMAGVTFFF